MDPQEVVDVAILGEALVGTSTIMLEGMDHPSSMHQREVDSILEEEVVPPLSGEEEVRLEGISLEVEEEGTVAGVVEKLPVRRETNRFEGYCCTLAG